MYRPGQYQYVHISLTQYAVERLHLSVEISFLSQHFVLIRCRYPVTALDREDAEQLLTSTGSKEYVWILKCKHSPKHFLKLIRRVYWYRHMRQSTLLQMVCGLSETVHWRRVGYIARAKGWLWLVSARATSESLTCPEWHWFRHWCGSHGGLTSKHILLNTCRFCDFLSVVLSAAWSRSRVQIRHTDWEAQATSVFLLHNECADVSVRIKVSRWVAPKWSLTQLLQKLLPAVQSSPSKSIQEFILGLKTSLWGFMDLMSVSVNSNVMLHFQVQFKVVAAKDSHRWLTVGTSYCI